MRMGFDVPWGKVLQAYRRRGQGRGHICSVGGCFGTSLLQLHSRAQINLLRYTLYQGNELKVRNKHSKETDISRISLQSGLVHHLSPPPTKRQSLWENGLSYALHYPFQLEQFLSHSNSLTDVSWLSEWMTEFFSGMVQESFYQRVRIWKWGTSQEWPQLPTWKPKYLNNRNI